MGFKRVAIGFGVTWFMFLGKVNAQVQLDTFTIAFDESYSYNQIEKEVIEPLVWQGYLTASLQRTGRGKWLVNRGHKFSFLVNTAKNKDSLISLEKYNRWVKEWLSEQNELGYPFASIRPGLIRQRQDTLEMELATSYGEQWHYDSVLFDNFALSDRSLKWAGGIKKGQVVSKAQNELLLQRLAAINGFGLSAANINYGKQGTIQLTRFPVRKTRRNFLSGIVGLNSDEGGNRTITGELEGEFYNIMNSGTGMQFSWQSFRARSQEFNFAVQSPYLFGLPFISTANFEFQKFDTLYTLTKRGLGFQFPLSREFIIGVRYDITDRSRIFPDVNFVRATRQLPNNPNSKSTLYGLQLLYRRGDLSYFSRKKITVNGTFSVGTRSFIKDAGIAAVTWVASDGSLENIYDSLERTSGLKSNQIRGNIDVNWHVPINKLFVLRLFSKVDFLDLPQVYFNELSRYGGIKTLLGFNEQSIFANQFYSVGSELRLVTGNNGFIGLQANAARYVNQSGQGGLPKETIFGAGLTTAINTRAGTLQIAWAMGNGASSRFGFNQSRFHFGLITNLDN